MDEMSKIILLERTSMFKAMSQLLNQSTTYGYNSSEIARDLKSYLAMQMQRVEMQNNSESILGELFLNQVDPDTFTSGDIISDFNSLRSRYPNNAFLESIKIVDIGTTRRPVRVLEFHTTRLSPERRDMVYTDLLNLMGSNVETDMMGPDNTPIKVTDKERAFRIAYHGMIKSGGKRGIGTYHQVLPAILSSPMSNALNKFQKGIIKLDERIKGKWDASVIEGENGKLVIPDEAKQEYAAGLRDILASTFAGRSADDIFTDAFTKIVSMKISDGTIEPYKRMVSVKKMEKYDIKVTNDFFVKFFNMITPGSAPNIINEKGVGQRLKISSKYKMDSGEYELFTPSDKELSIDLNHPDMKLDAQKQVLSYFGIRYNPGFDNFSFPLFKVNAYGQIMILKSIDNDSLGTRFIDSLYLAPFTNSQLTDLSGNSAVYEVVPMEGVARVSPLAFTSLEGAMIRNIAMGQVQQISSKKMIDVPPGMNIISSQNRMWMFNESDTLDRDYTNKTMSTVDFNIVNTGERAYHFEMNRNNSIVQVNKDGSVFAVNPQSYDMLAQRLGKASWADVIADPQFEDFLSGKTNIFMFELINGDIQTPVTPVSQPAASVSQLSAPEAQPTSVKPTIEVGRYVRYKDSEYIITKIIKENLVQIYSPLKEGPNSKLTVSPSNLTFVDIKAQMVEYKDKQYLVTPRNSIISLTTNKIMQWGEENGDRRAILELAAQARESTGIDIEKLKQQREEVIKQKTDESRNCNNPKT
jgi:hypothetical protein